MKKLLTLALAALTAVSVAQYNNTYDVNANTNNLTPHFVITNKKLESITVSYASTKPTEPRIDYFIITKHDPSGNVIYNNRITPFSGPKDGITNVEALIQTDDDGVLIAGYYYPDDSYIEQPILIKVDVNGNFLWSRIYYVNKLAIVASETNKMSLCRVQDDVDENYFIVGSGDSDKNPGIDVTTNVIKVDKNGALIFSKKYYDTGASVFATLREYPGDIAYSTKDKFYMITGYRQAVSSTTKGELMYFFGINSTGAVVTKYKTLESSSVPLDQDMIYDDKLNVFATTFTHAKNLYVPTLSSLIGFITINSALTVTNPRYLWHNEGSENNGRSISLCKDYNYLICSAIYDPATATHNPGWLKVNPAGNPLSDLLRYNTKDDANFGHHATSSNPVTGDDEYVLINEQKTDLRVIRTDVGGKACGVESFKSFVKTYVPKQVLYIYKDATSGEIKDYKPNEKLFLPDYRKCVDPGTSYRTTGIAEIGSSETMTALYPSVMSLNNASMILENNSGTAVKLEIYSITGQLFYSNPEIPSGKTELQLNANGRLSEGMYLVKVYTANGSLTTTSKIIITK